MSWLMYIIINIAKSYLFRRSIYFKNECMSVLQHLRNTICSIIKIAYYRKGQHAETFQEFYENGRLLRQCVIFNVNLIVHL